MNHDIVMKVLGVVAALMLVVVLWSAYYEATFDYTKCSPTDQYRTQRTEAWVQMQKVGDVTIPITHPAREWTERLYKCPDEKGKGRFDKWRTEDKP